jgi:hypothetical protein
MRNMKSQIGCFKHALKFNVNVLYSGEMKIMHINLLTGSCCFFHQTDNLLHYVEKFIKIKIRNFDIISSFHLMEKKSFDICH